MAEKHYQLLAGETKFLKIKWDSSWRDLSLILDGRTILVVPDYRSLKEGRSVTLNDGTTFFVQLKNGFLTHQLSVWMNDVALSEPTGDPEDRLKGAYFVLFLLAGINGLVGLATRFLRQRPEPRRERPVDASHLAARRGGEGPASAGA